MAEDALKQNQQITNFGLANNECSFQAKVPTKWIIIAVLSLILCQSLLLMRTTTKNSDILRDIK